MTAPAACGLCAGQGTFVAPFDILVCQACNGTGGQVNTMEQEKILEDMSNMDILKEFRKLGVEMTYGGHEAWRDSSAFRLSRKQAEALLERLRLLEEHAEGSLRE